MKMNGSEVLETEVLECRSDADDRCIAPNTVRYLTELHVQ